MNTYKNIYAHIEQACRSIAPLWPLQHFVAVNPFLGYADRPFEETAEHLKQIHGDYPLPKLAWYLERYAEGQIDQPQLREAIETAGNDCRAAFEGQGLPLDEKSFLKLSKQDVPIEESLYKLRTFTAFIDQREGTAWNHLVRQEAAKWCAAHFDQGQSSWRSPWHGLSLFEGWKKAMHYDKTLYCSGIKTTISAIDEMPSDPTQAIAYSLSTLQVPEERAADILERAMLELTGWSGYLRYLDREQELRDGASDYGLQLLAILLAYEVIIYRALCLDTDRVLSWKRSLLEDPSDTGESNIPLELALRLIWQSSLESCAEDQFRHAIEPRKGAAQARPELQAVFCIDVRSEPLRRALESVMPTAQTIGFAGFFGIPAEHHVAGKPRTQALCPALLAPPVKTAQSLADLRGVEWRRLESDRALKVGKKRAWKSFRESASSCFTFVETMGLVYAYKLLKDAFGLSKPKAKTSKAMPHFAQDMEGSQKLALAESILRGLSLTGNFAPQVLLCGHGGESANNPYASSLDCGACGGHAGDVNARLAANLLNEATIRRGLDGRGIEIPSDTRFIAGIHNTTTDEISIFEEPSSENEALRKALAQAGDLCLLQRSASLGHGTLAVSAEQLRKRSRDWSQVRPEWGLAGNAAFIVAPRSWTQPSNLAGKAFLHEYDPALDKSRSLLKGILGGPLVVGSWINLQYYASAINNETYGSGHKTIHNVVGGIGVALGNEYDLKTGLPLQSVHDGETLMHTPCRLLACIAAEPQELDAILAENAHLNDLVRNEWIHMVSLGENGNSWLKRLPNGKWGRDLFLSRH